MRRLAEAMRAGRIWAVRRVTELRIGWHSAQAARHFAAAERHLAAFSALLRRRGQ